MNKLQKLKAEIERLYKETKEEPYTLRAEGKLEALDKLDAFIDSLEEESVSEDLEKAAIRIADEILPIAGREIWYGETEENIKRREQIREGVKRGANWQKEKMMKDAVDGEVGYWNITGLSINMKLPKCIDEDDKVKVIIVKEE